MVSNTQNGNNHELGVDPEALWQAADKLRGSIDAAEYKHVARVWLPDEPENDARQICSTEFLVVVPKEGWSREQLYCQFVEVGFRRMLEQRASGTSNSHQRIKQKDFEKTVVVSPLMNVREAFFESVGPIFAKAANGHRESQTLAAIRDTLLPKLISGELRVPDVGKAVENTL